MESILKACIGVGGWYIHLLLHGHLPNDFRSKTFFRPLFSNEKPYAHLKFDPDLKPLLPSKHYKVIHHQQSSFKATQFFIRTLGADRMRPSLEKPGSGLHFSLSGSPGPALGGTWGFRWNTARARFMGSKPGCPERALCTYLLTRFSQTLTG